MPQPDPLPPSRHATMRRFWRIFRLLAVLSVATATTAVLLVARGDNGTHVHMLVATALMAGLVVLLGGALMTVAFLSSSSGYDEQATTRSREDDHQ